MKNWLQSSQNPSQVANTVRGAVLAATGALLLGARLLNLPFTEADIVELAAQLGAVVGGIWFLYGLLMKLVMFLGKE